MSGCQTKDFDLVGSLTFMNPVSCISANLKRQ